MPEYTSVLLRPRKPLPITAFGLPGALGGQRTAHNKHMEALCPPKKMRGVTKAAT